MDAPLTPRLSRLVWAEASSGERAAFLARPEGHNAAEAAVAAMFEDIQARGDASVRDYAQRFDGYAPEDFRVPSAAMAAAAKALAPEDRAAILAAHRAVRAFHAPQGYRAYAQETWPGVAAERRVEPLSVVGLYAPAGSAPLVSTLIMLEAPSYVAGVSRRPVLIPPRGADGIDPVMLAAAHLIGLEEVYAIGGAHGVFALGLGLCGLPRAEKIFGPGNAYVAAAKARLAARPQGPGADLPAGPSEVMVIADDAADPAFVAADLLAQAEHDALAQVVLAAFSTAFIDRVEAEIARQLPDLPTAPTASASLGAARAILVTGVDEAAAAANAYAPEHLIVQTAAPRALAGQVRAAGSIFLGAWTPEAMGDYAAGPNHTMPTGGAARRFGGVTVEMFQRTVTVLEASAAGAGAIAETVERLAALEGLEPHRRSMAIRRKG